MQVVQSPTGGEFKPGVRETLAGIGAEHVWLIGVLNKCDLQDAVELRQDVIDAIKVSALKKAGA